MALVLGWLGLQVQALEHECVRLTFHAGYLSLSVDASPLHNRSPSQSPSIQLRQAESGEPTSGLEPLTCSLRVIHHTLQGCAVDCKTLISKRFFYSVHCPVLHRIAFSVVSEWYQESVD